VNYADALLKYGRLALATGKKLIFVPIRREREGKMAWKIYLQSIVCEGEEDIRDFEDDIV